jgi:hypothetical protein
MNQPPDNHRGVAADRIALAAAVLPAVLFPTTYLLAAFGGNVAWCVPPLQGCTDITHTGLRAPESHLFRVAMPFVCGLFVLVWMIAYDWVRDHGGIAGRRETRFRRLGVIAAVGLLVGEMVLQGKETLWVLHSVGATLFFILTYAALIIHHRSMQALALKEPGRLTRVSLTTKRVVVWFQTLMLVLAVVFRVVDWSEGGRVLQWLTTYSILVYVLTLSWDWRGYRIRLAGFSAR